MSWRASPDYCGAYCDSLSLDSWEDGAAAGAEGATGSDAEDRGGNGPATALGTATGCVSTAAAEAGSTAAGATITGSAYMGCEAGGAGILGALARFAAAVAAGTRASLRGDIGRIAVAAPAGRGAAWAASCLRSSSLSAR